MAVIVKSANFLSKVHLYATTFFHLKPHCAVNVFYINKHVFGECHRQIVSSSVLLNTKSNCWKCGKDISLAFGSYECKCGVLQPPPDNISLFDVLNEEESFDIDQTALTTKFRKLQSILHPDKFTTKSKVSASFIINTQYPARPL